MKRTLAHSGNAKQFWSKIDGQKFYLGADARPAEQRKQTIRRYKDSLGDDWTPTTFAHAKRIAKGEQVVVTTTADEDADERSFLVVSAR